MSKIPLTNPKVIQIVQTKRGLYLFHQPSRCFFSSFFILSISFCLPLRVISFSPSLSVFRFVSFHRLFFDHFSFTKKKKTWRSQSFTRLLSAKCVEWDFFSRFLAHICKNHDIFMHMKWMTIKICIRSYKLWWMNMRNVRVTAAANDTRTFLFNVTAIVATQRFHSCKAMTMWITNNQQQCITKTHTHNGYQARKKSFYVNNVRLDLPISVLTLWGESFA